MARKLDFHQLINLFQDKEFESLLSNVKLTPAITFLKKVGPLFLYADGSII